MAMVKLPLYVRVSENSALGGGYALYGAGKAMSNDARTLLQIKLTLEIEESLLQGVIDTQATVSIGSYDLDSTTVIAGLRELVKDDQTALHDPRP